MASRCTMRGCRMARANAVTPFGLGASLMLIPLILMGRAILALSEPRRRCPTGALR